jgi:hypothetical protein
VVELYLNTEYNKSIKPQINAFAQYSPTPGSILRVIVKPSIIRRAAITNLISNPFVAILHSA